MSTRAVFGKSWKCLDAWGAKSEACEACSARDKRPVVFWMSPLRILRHSLKNEGTLLNPQNGIKRDSLVKTTDWMRDLWFWDVDLMYSIPIIREATATTTATTATTTTTTATTTTNAATATATATVATEQQQGQQQLQQSYDPEHEYECIHVQMYWLGASSLPLHDH